MDNKNQKGNGLVIALVLVAVFIGFGALFYSGAKEQKEALEAPLPLVEETRRDEVPEGAVIEIGAEDEMLPTPGSEEGAVVARPFKEFDVTGKNYEFSLKEIRVTKGDFVRINFTSTDGFHDLKIDEFNVAAERVSTGNSSLVDFVADKTGTFPYYCSIGSHRQMGMAGKLIVEE